MRALVGSAILVLLCSACVAAPPPVAATVTDFEAKVAADDPNCRDYTGQAMIDGAPQPVVGRACRQSDGSWRIAEGTATNPNQFVAVYPAPYYPAYSPGYGLYDPWLWDAPFGFGAGFVFFDRRFHHHGFHGGGFAHHGGGWGGHHHG
ncbi:MAG TPA: hypothetical protein VGV37_24715 [Aliidongia sp.]|uniref:hypothetical protein n=1 Tax=Aliidongia sp. TaxID=1914230 RepID=UPI002DDCEC81|nr:hypothetical protein [Aliidongia sp.]HEV2677757.1 hypothetical protein [Aliidongia sp.]